MAAIANDIDRAFDANPAPADPPADRLLLIGCDSPGGFKVAANGAATPAVITFTAIRFNLDGTANFAATEGAALNVAGDSATLAYADMPGDSTTVSARVTDIDGIVHERLVTIAKVRDGQNADPNDPVDLSPAALLDALEGQITESTLYASLRARIGLIDGAADLAGSVAARVKAETDQRIAAISQQAQESQTYVQQFTYSKQSINDSFSAFGTNIQASYQGYANNAADGALAAAKSFAQSYGYSRSDSDSALTATANQLRSEFQTLNQGAGATVAWVTEYAYSKAQANDAIAAATQQLSTTVAGHTSTLEIQGQSISGLGAQYTVKIDNNNYVSGFGLASTAINGVPTSSFIVLADKFAVALPGQAAKYPFVVGTVNGQTVIGLRGDVVLDGTFTFRDATGKPLLGVGVPLDKSLAAPDTLNSDLAPSIPVDLVLIPFNVAVTGNRAVKNGVSTAWDAQVASKDGFAGGAFVSGSVDGLCTLMFGLNTDPHTDANFASIDFAIYAYVNGTLQAYESGVQRANLGNYAAGDLLSVIYDGSAVRYCKNGAVLYTSVLAAPVTGPLYLDSSFNSPGAALSNIRFGPMSSNAWGSIGGQGKPQDNATVGAEIGKNLTGAFTKDNISTFIEAAAIGLALIDKASIGNLAALSAYLGSAEIGPGGNLRQGQTAFHTGTGFWLGDSGGVPKFSIGKPGTSSLRWDGAQLISENLNTSMTPLPVSITTTGGNLTTSYSRNASAATTVVGYVNVTGGSGNYTYSWSVTADGYACWTTNPAGNNCAGVMKGPGIALPDGVGFTLVCTVTDQTTGRTGQASFSPTIIFS